MSSSRSLRPWPRRCTTPHEDRRRQGPGEEYETQYTAKFRKHSSPKSPAHSTSRSTTTTVCRSSGAPGLTASTRSGRRSGYSGAPWSRSSTTCRLSLFSTPPSRRWWTQWWTCGRSWTTLFLVGRPGRLPGCPGSLCAMPLRAPRSLSRRWWNSWWRCPSRSRSLWLMARTTVAFVGGTCGVGVAVPTGGWSAPTTPRGPAQMGSLPAQGGIQILGNFIFLGVDVSVTMLDKFQQSMLEKLEVPRIQFLDRSVDIPVGLRWRCTVHTVQRTVVFHRSTSWVWC